MDASQSRTVEQLVVLRCQAGDGRAFEELMLRYDPRLRYYLRKIVGVTQDADDLLQDVWLDVFRKIGKLRRPASFRPWIYRIARDRAFQELRRRRQLPQTMVEPVAVDAPEEPDFTPLDAAAIHACLEKLRPQHQDVLLLRFLEEMSYEEISQATGTPVGTVRSRIHYAKRALRREMERMNYGRARTEKTTPQPGSGQH